MKPLVKLGVGLAAAYLVIMLVSGLAIQMMVSGSADTIREQLESHVPIPVSFGDGDFDLAQWFLFQPAITLHDVSIGNPDGFSKSNLLDASEVSTQVALFSLFGDRIEIRSVTLGHPVLRVERNRQGKTNLEVAAALIANSATQGAASASEGAEGSEGKALAIEGFYLDQGEVWYADAAKDSGNPTMFVGDIDLRLLDFSTDATCKLTLQASFYGGSRSEVRFNGRGGPFRSQSLPAQGELAIEIAPSEIPADLREEYLGELLHDPPGGSMVAFETTMQGDLMKTFQGDGKLTFSDFGEWRRTSPASQRRGSVETYRQAHDDQPVVRLGDPGWLPDAWRRDLERASEGLLCKLESPGVEQRKHRRRRYRPDDERIGVRQR